MAHGVNQSRWLSLLQPGCKPETSSESTSFWSRIATARPRDVAHTPNPGLPLAVSAYVKTASLDQSAFAPLREMIPK